MINLIKGVCAFYLLFLSFLTLLSLGQVLNNSPHSMFDHCDDPLRRIEYVLPSHIIACWLGR